MLSQKKKQFLLYSSHSHKAYELGNDLNSSVNRDYEQKVMPANSNLTSLRLSSINEHLTFSNQISDFAFLLVGDIAFSGSLRLTVVLMMIKW